MVYDLGQFGLDATSLARLGLATGTDMEAGFRRTELSPGLQHHWCLRRSHELDEFCQAFEALLMQDTPSSIYQAVRILCGTELTNYLVENQYLFLS